MAASSSCSTPSSSTPPWRCEPLSSSSDVPKHEIFLSHSGAQKPFVRALYPLLSRHYSTFFDITHHSLPLGEQFPPLIFKAARTCRLAVVVLSEQYVRSKWPMLELCAFVAVTPRPPLILPVFLRLAPYDLKQKQKQDEWRSAWQKFAEEDHSRIDVSTWESALRKLSSYNGIILNEGEEESAFIKRVFAGICGTLPPSLRHDFSGMPGIHRLSEIVLSEFEALDSDRSRVCVLGMHGLPGSGKSTICRYLRDCMFSEFAGKVIYLELPPNANDEEVSIKSMELLTQLTNFNNKIDLTEVLNFRQVYHLLRGTDVVHARVFLVVDNISSRESGDFVKALLRLGLAVGSRVLLAAHSISVLRPLLQEDRSLQRISHYVYGSINVPSLNEEEALKVLLQFGDGLGLADSYAPEAALIPWKREIMEEVVRMSSFRQKHGYPIHLPLVLNRMGQNLKEHELDVGEWNRTMKSFWRERGLCKEAILQEMVLESFRKLSKKHQTLFLDVALFIVPLSYLDVESNDLNEACLHLSLIHGCELEEIVLKMRELQKHGFLMIWNGEHSTPTISVHDFYLEFAACSEEASEYYWSSSFRWSKFKSDDAIKVVNTIKFEVRTVVLELDEGYEHFEFSSKLSRAKAIILRNCKSLRSLRGFANLTCLVSLEIHNCPSVEWVQLPATCYELPDLQRFRWISRENKGQCVEALSSKTPFWKVLWDSCPWSRFKRSPYMIPLDRLLLQMKALQVLRLVNTGIRQSVDMSGCLPLLRVLEVRERHVEHLHVRNLPNLEHFVYVGYDAEWFRSSFDIRLSDDISSTDPIYTQDSVHNCPRKGVITEKEFLAGCPNLLEVYVQCVSFENEPQAITLASCHLKKLRVHRLWNVSKFPDLSASAESLEQLLLWDCIGFRRLNFGCVYRNLEWLDLEQCVNVTEVSGLERLPKLQKLSIQGCTSLKRVNGLGGLVSLRDLLVECASLQQCLLPDLENLSELRNIKYKGPWLHDGTFNMRKLVHLELFDLEYCSSDKLVDLGVKVIGLEGLKSLGEVVLSDWTWLHCRALYKGIPVDLAKLFRMWHGSSLKKLEFIGLRSLRSLNGIEFLYSLEVLRLQFLQNLSCLHGLEFLRELETLSLCNCPSVEEMPSLSGLVKLQWICCTNCLKLRGVEGLQQSLESVTLTGCTSLAHFPLDLKNVHTCIRWLQIEGSKFASGEALVAWAEDEEVSQVLRRASLAALRWELSRSANKKRIREMLLDSVVQKVLDRCCKGNDNNIDEEVVASQVSLIARDFDDTILDIDLHWQHEAFAKVRASHSVLEEVLHCFARLPKRCLIEICQSDSHFTPLLYHLFHHLCKGVEEEPDFESP